MLFSPSLPVLEVPFAVHRAYSLVFRFSGTVRLGTVPLVILQDVARPLPSNSSLAGYLGNTTILFRFSRRGFSILSVYVRDSSLAIREHSAHDPTSAACGYS